MLEMLFVMVINGIITHEVFINHAVNAFEVVKKSVGV